MKKFRTLIVFMAAVSLLTACETPSSDAESDAKAEIQSETTENLSGENISTGYITVGDNDYVELYQEAETQNVIARMYDGEAITIYSINSDTAYISYGGMKGYAKLIYISFTKPEQKTETPVTDAPAETTAAQNQPAEPAETAPPVVQNNVQNNNVQILFYVDNDGVEVAEPTYYSSYVSESSTAAWCSAQSIYIYSQPTTDSYKREADMLYYGDVCYILGSVDGWYYISTDSGSGYDLHGYVKQKYITIGSTPVAPEPANASHGRVSAGSANVRSSPDKSNNSNVLFSLSQGAEFDVLSYDGYWYEINYNGTICYISHKMVEVW